MKIPLSITLVASALSALITLAAARPVQEVEVAPYVSAERVIYGLELSHPTRELFPELRSVDGVKIIGVRGNWALVEFQGLTRGPIWINFDQVISYRTDQ